MSDYKLPQAFYSDTFFVSVSVSLCASVPLSVCLCLSFSCSVRLSASLSVPLICPSFCLCLSLCVPFVCLSLRLCLSPSLKKVADFSVFTHLHHTDTVCVLLSLKEIQRNCE